MQERPSLATTRSISNSRFSVDHSELSFAEDEGDAEADADSPMVAPPEPEADFLNLALKFLDQAARR